MISFESVYPGSKQDSTISAVFWYAKSVLEKRIRDKDFSTPYHIVSLFEDSLLGDTVVTVVFDYSSDRCCSRDAISSITVSTVNGGMFLYVEPIYGGSYLKGFDAIVRSSVSKEVFDKLHHSLALYSSLMKLQ